MRSMNRGIRTCVIAAGKRLNTLRGYFPWTSRGFGAGLVSGGTIWYYGLLREDRFLLALGVMGLTLTLVSAMGVGVGWLVLRKQVSTRMTDKIECSGETNREMASGFSVRVPRGLMFLSLNWSWNTPREVNVSQRADGQTLYERINFQRRGRVHSLTRVFYLSEPLGLAALSWKVAQEAALEIHPHTGKLEQIPLFSSLKSGDGVSYPNPEARGDLHDLRGYHPGDPIRYILWHVFAKSRTLAVRAPEQALSPDQTFMAYFYPSPTDPAAAGTLRAMLKHLPSTSRCRIGIAGNSKVFDEVEEAEQALLDSVNYRNDYSESPTLGSFLQQLHSSPENRVRVLLAPPLNQAWLKWVTQELSRASRVCQTEVWLCVDGFVPLSEAGWKNWIWNPASDAGGTGLSNVDVKKLSRTLPQLKSHAHSVQVINREQGKQFSASQFQNLSS
ncbi:MAG: DUF58 domain-containing protein [SAR324 cluster bacterium]|nr:DUF58 domain-containing protein [SAR324 cluster bacterium]